MRLWHVIPIIHHNIIYYKVQKYTFREIRKHLKRNPKQTLIGFLCNSRITKKSASKLAMKRSIQDDIRFRWRTTITVAKVLEEIKHIEKISEDLTMSSMKLSEISDSEKAELKNKFGISASLLCDTVSILNKNVKNMKEILNTTEVAIK